MSIVMVLRRLALAVLMLGGATTAAFPQADEEAVDPPGRVGRLSYMEGTVSFHNADEDQWVPATQNFPVTAGDAFWTEPNSRAEIQIGSTDLRLDQMTAIEFVHLDDDATEIQVEQGSINLRVREMPPGGVRILTPHASVVVTQPGRYHVDAAAPQGSEPGDQVRIAVLEGAARIDGLSSPLTVTAGHSATIRADQPYPMLAQAIALPLDTWALERERLLNPQQALQYVSPEMTGVRDLDNYGQWVTEPSYGAVWYPQAVADDWAPYRYGHWAHVRPWGWTWVDHQPWGFAPFHYGRWVRVRDRWGWCPGTRVHRPVFAPALVAFAGGGGFAVLTSSGRRAPAVGWVPLGPHEVFRPHYRHSLRHVRDVNVTNVNVTNITVINKDRDRDGRDRDRAGDRRRDEDRDSIRGFRNRDGMTVVSADSFTGAAAVDKVRVRVRDDDLAGARRTDSLDGLKPSRSARAGVVVPDVAPSHGIAPAIAESRQGSRRGERDDDRRAPANARPAMTAASVPSRDPDVLPRAPGPNRERNPNASRDRQRPDAARSVAQQDRERAVTPLNRSDRAAPALRTPDSNTAAPPALRVVEPPGRTPSGTVTNAPPGRGSGAAANRPADPPGRISNPNRDGRDGMRDSREPTGVRLDEPRSGPRSITPAQQPRQIAPAQSPGTAPNTVAPTRPTPLQAAPSTTQENRRDAVRPETRPDAARSDRARSDRARPGSAQPGSEKRRDEPRVITPPAQSRSMGPSRESTSSIQRSSRPESAAPQRIAPPQSRREEREVRREPMRQDSAPTRTTIMPPQNSRPAPQQQPMRQVQPQNAERRSPQAAQAPSRAPQQDASPRRSDSQGRGRAKDGGGRRSE